MIFAIRKNLLKAANEEDGQGIVEYALILVLSSVALVTALGMFGSTLAERFDEIVNVVSSL
ncbi:MAG TPA: Flp family type IVb pilin [Planctomycetota bacterium]|nr:Flp family type IVb pilin [Planctomycetota bacterium]